MPANLTPQYFEAERRFKSATTPEEKIQALEAMLAVMPKHKGTDHLQADLRRKIAKISEEAERKYATSRKNFNVRREGAGQVALIGPPNTGKSLLLASLTSVNPEIAGYPFTTKSPNVGMMPYENIQIQLVDMPAINLEESRVWSNTVLRNADLLAIVVDLTSDPVRQVEETLQGLGEISVVPFKPGVDNSGTGLRERRTFIIANVGDLDIDDEGINALNARFDGWLDAVRVSAAEKQNLEELKRQIFTRLKIMRVHTKSPGARVDLTDPVILPAGATIKDAAEAVHKDFKSGLRYAVIWGSGKFDGQRVGPEHVLRDNDIIELHV